MTDSEVDVEDALSWIRENCLPRPQELWLIVAYETVLHGSASARRIGEIYGGAASKVGEVLHKELCGSVVGREIPDLAVVEEANGRTFRVPVMAGRSDERTKAAIARDLDEVRSRKVLLPSRSEVGEIDRIRARVKIARGCSTNPVALSESLKELPIASVRELGDEELLYQVYLLHIGLATQNGVWEEGIALGHETIKLVAPSSDELATLHGYLSCCYRYGASTALDESTRKEQLRLAEAESEKAKLVHCDPHCDMRGNVLTQNRRWIEAHLAEERALLGDHDSARGALDTSLALAAETSRTDRVEEELLASKVALSLKSPREAEQAFARIDGLTKRAYALKQWIRGPVHRYRSELLHAVAPDQRTEIVNEMDKAAQLCKSYAPHEIAIAFNVAAWKDLQRTALDRKSVRDLISRVHRRLTGVPIRACHRTCRASTALDHLKCALGARWGRQAA